MKFNVGDKVRVKENICHEWAKRETRESIPIHVGMIAMRGKVYEVTEVDGFDSTCRLNDGFWFEEDWLEPVKIKEENKTGLTLADLQFGDVAETREGCLMMFVTRDFGFSEIDTQQSALTSNTDYVTTIISCKGYTSDFKHVDKGRDIIKVYRTDKPVRATLPEGLCDYRVIWEENKIYYTLGEAIATGKQVKHKDSDRFESLTNHIDYAFLVLVHAKQATNRKLFDLIKAKEYEVKE